MKTVTHLLRYNHSLVRSLLLTRITFVGGTRENVWKETSISTLLSVMIIRSSEFMSSQYDFAKSQRTKIPNNRPALSSAQRLYSWKQKTIPMWPVSTATFPIWIHTMWGIHSRGGPVEIKQVQGGQAGPQSKARAPPKPRCFEILD